MDSPGKQEEETLSLVMENCRVTLTVSASYITSANVMSDKTMGGMEDS